MFAAGFEALKLCFRGSFLAHLLHISSSILQIFCGLTHTKFFPSVFVFSTTKPASLLAGFGQKLRRSRGDSAEI